MDVHMLRIDCSKADLSHSVNVWCDNCSVTDIDDLVVWLALAKVFADNWQTHLDAKPKTGMAAVGANVEKITRR